MAFRQYESVGGCPNTVSGKMQLDIQCIEMDALEL